MAVNAIDNMKFIVASDKPNILKLTFLQLGKTLFKLCNNSFLSVVSIFSFVHPEYSLKILFSIPKWYPEIIILPKKVVIRRWHQILFFEKKYPKKHITIDITYGILWYKHNLHAGMDKIYSIYNADKIVKILMSKINKKKLFSVLWNILTHKVTNIVIQ